MVSSATEELLEAATHGGSIESKDWPQALELILSKLEYIIKNDFPVPTIPAPDPPPPPLAEPSSQSSTSTNKENAPPRPPVPSFSASATNSQATADPTQPRTPDTLMADSSPPIPQPMIDLHNGIKTTLTKSFPRNPPHTLQRLAELIQYPKTHYRFLPSYLRAVDRVICVSSGAHIFPLPNAVLPPSGPGGLLNGAAHLSAASNLGSDESLGGALLTPIPWLKPDRAGEEGISPTQSQSQNQRQGQQSPSQNELKSEETEMVDGPNGVGRVETVSVVNGVFATTGTGSGAAPASGNRNASSASTNDAANGSGAAATGTNVAPADVEEHIREAGAVTQGELLRLEQEAGVVPVSVASRSPTRLRTAPAAEGEGRGVEEGADEAMADHQVEGEAKEEVPHARGPEEIGAADVGPGQERMGATAGGLDMEKAVGRSLPHGEGGEESAAESKDDVDMKEAQRQDAEGGVKQLEERSGAEDAINKAEDEGSDLPSGADDENLGQKGEELDGESAQS